MGTAQFVAQITQRTLVVFGIQTVEKLRDSAVATCFELEPKVTVASRHHHDTDVREFARLDKRRKTHNGVLAGHVIHDVFQKSSC